MPGTIISESRKMSMNLLSKIWCNKLNLYLSKAKDKESVLYG